MISFRARALNFATQKIKKGNSLITSHIAKIVITQNLKQLES